MPRLVWCVLTVALAACQADAWSPDAAHRRASSRRAAALAAHLETLPGVAHASVILDEPTADPLAPPSPVAPPRASVVLALSPGADTDTTTAAARAAVLASIAGLDAHTLSVIAAAPPPPPRPRALVLPLAAALLAIIGLSLWIALTALHRRRLALKVPRT